MSFNEVNYWDQNQMCSFLLKKIRLYTLYILLNSLLSSKNLPLHKFQVMMFIPYSGLLRGFKQRKMCICWAYEWTINIVFLTHRHTHTTPKKNNAEKTVWTQLCAFKIKREKSKHILWAIIWKKVYCLKLRIISFI